MGPIHPRTLLGSGACPSPAGAAPRRRSDDGVAADGPRYDTRVVVAARRTDRQPAGTTLSDGAGTSGLTSHTEARRGELPLIGSLGP